MSKSICVYCGSRSGMNPDYLHAAQDLGKSIADQGYRLVYGAGDVGLMGAVANAAQEHGAKTFGVIPQHLLEWEVGKRDLTSFIVTENMHERKKVMVMNADAFILLPGGLGSLDEFFELVTWRQLGLHSKPCVVLNIAGYWDPLHALIEQQIKEGFVTPENRAYFTFVETVEDAMSEVARQLSDA